MIWPRPLRTLPPEAERSSSDWLIGLARSGPCEDFDPLQLAWLGNAAWELHPRRRRCFEPGPVPSALHAATVESVRASTKAQQLRVLEPWLTEGERDVARQGREPCGTVASRRRGRQLCAGHGI